MNGTISILFSRQSKSGKPKKFIQLFCENKKKKKKKVSVRSGKKKPCKLSRNVHYVKEG